ncbi:hypothetical protein C1910_10935 [Listeria ivanovii]|uniref:hypothetical protein n=1 Tax=Listeria ivanovii TaxID=1638 RepID=UPI000DA8EBCC|nr:hypothetical protein [Listeria ivanovii]PZG37805.1 hypothetical protein C1910_10935 [Listeria ivanovii]
MHINYNMNQLILPMDLETMIPENHVSHIIHQQVEEIPEIDVRNWQTTEDCPADALHSVSERAKAGTSSRAKIVTIRIENLSLNFRYGFFHFRDSIISCLFLGL